ncbi:MAG: acyl carrier protein [Vicinamibacteraceae bacterium]|nr:acyl carrier protein [Vicinamibacteraceae bacterium]
MTSGPTRPADETIAAILLERLPLVSRDKPLADDTRLGAQGLGFDSVSIVEIILECEAALGIAFPATLFDDGPITVGRLKRHAAEQVTAAARA